MAVGDVNVQVTNPITYEGAYFDGVDDFIDLGSNQLLNFGNKTFSISLWYKQQQVGGFPLSSRTGSAAAGYELLCDAGSVAGNDFFRVHDGTNSYNSNLMQSNFGKWNHAVMVFDRTTNLHTAYINNVAVAAIIITTAGAINNTQNPMLAKRLTSFTKCLVRNLMIFEEALNTDDVSKLYSERNINKKPVASFKLNGNIIDSTGNNIANASGSIFQSNNQNLADAIKAQRVAATDKFLLTDVAGGGVISSEIEGA